MFHLHPLQSAQRTSAALAVAAVLAAAGLTGHGAMPASACGLFGCDRPGTPDNLSTLVNVGPQQSITVFWTNTASESTCVEFATTKDGGAVDLGTGCLRDGSGPAAAHEFDNLQRQAQYCFQVRARDWNNGDPQDGLVSDQWSAPVCATIGPAPTQPSKPVSPTSEPVEPNLIPSTPTLPGISAATVASLPLLGTVAVPPPQGH
jgi:hypothetical protein